MEEPGLERLRHAFDEQGGSESVVGNEPQRVDTLLLFTVRTAKNNYMDTLMNKELTIPQLVVCSPNRFATLFKFPTMKSSCPVWGMEGAVPDACEFWVMYL